MTNRSYPVLGALLLALLFLAHPAFAQTPQGLTVNQLPAGPGISDSDTIMVSPAGGGPAKRQTVGTLKSYFNALTPSINSIALTPNSFVATAGNATNVVGALTAQVSSGAFGGSFGLATNGTCPGPDNGAFSLTSSTLSVGAVDVTVAKTYTLCIRATDTNFANSPAFFPIVVTGTTAPPAATISSVGVSPGSFTAQAGNQNATIGTLATVVSSGTFGGTYALSTSGGCSGHGADNASFAITGATLKVGGSAVTVAQDYHICVAATDSAYSNSPFGAQITVTGTAPPPVFTISSVGLSPSSFTAQAGNANSTVGTLSTVVSNGTFAGTYALSTSGGCAGHGANNGSFTITGSTLKIGASDVTTAQAYAICLLATDAAYSNSPFAQQITVTGTAGAPTATITSVAASPATFVATTGNANATVGSLSTTVSTGSFAGTYALSTAGGCSGHGADNASFAISGTTLKLTGSDVTSVRSYAICLTATDAAFSNSPFAQQLTITGTTGPPATITSVSVSPATFAAQVGNANATVGSLSTAVSAGSFAGVYALATSGGCTGTDNGTFAISGSTLKIGSVDVTGASAYTICVRSTDAAFSNSPLFQALTVTGTGGPAATITGVSVSPASFASATGNATSTVGTLSAAVSAGSFTGTFALATDASCTSTDNSKFSTTGATLKVGATDILNGGTYTICVSATQASFSNSPKFQTISVTATGASIAAPSVVSPGSTFSVTITGAPGQQSHDWVAIYRAGESGNSYLDWKYLANNAQTGPSAPATSGTVTLTADASPGPFIVRFMPNDVFTPVLAEVPFTSSGSPTISSVSLSPSSFTAQAGNATSTVGTLTPNVSGGSFAGTLALATGAGCTSTDNGKFTTTGATLKIGASDILVAGPYTICVSATDAAFSNSPKLQQLTVTGTAVAPPGTISSVSLNPSSFVAQAGNANATVGTLTTNVSSGTPAPTYAFSTTGGCAGLGADNASFAIAGSALRLTGSDVTSVRNYAVCVTSTDSAYSNSPFPQGLTVAGTAIGTATITMTFKNESGSTMAAGTPVSFGQGFRYGDIAPGTHPIIRDASTHVVLPGQQWDEISTRRENGQDGSWRHAVWSAWLPSSLANGATYQVEFVPTAGAYSESSHQPLSALCSGPAAHDLQIHLTDVRNQDDTVRDSGDATFRVCDNIANTGRDAPRHIAAGNVMDEYVVSGMFVYTGGHKDPLLYAQCDINLYTKASDGTSTGDVKWVCHGLNPWMNVTQGSTGHAGNIGPAGFTNDPQMVSYKADILDGSTSVLNWSGLDATVTNSTAQLTPLTDPNTSGGNCNYYSTYVDHCLNIPSSTGANTWYYGQGVRVSCSGACLPGLTNGQLLYAFPSSQASTQNSTNTWISLMTTPTGAGTANTLTGATGSGTTTLSARIPHYHWQAWDTVDSTGLPNWSPFGTTSRVTRKAYPALTSSEKLYWEQAGLVVPLFLAQPANNQLINWQQGLGNLYNPMGRGNMIGTGATGARADIGIINEYSAQAFVSQSEGDWNLARLATYGSIVDGFNAILDEATARIPVLNNGPPTGPGGNGNGGSYTGLGGGNTTNNNTSHIPPGFIENMASPFGKNSPSGQDIASGLVYTGNDHMPGFNGISYMIFGERQFLDIMQWRAEADFMQNQPGPADYPGALHIRDNTAVFTNGQTYHYYGLMSNTMQGRGSAWMQRDVTYGATFGADDYPLAPAFAGNPERSYFHDLITENGNYYPLHLTSVDGPGNFNAEGSTYAPNTARNDGAPYNETFIKAYISSVDYILTAWLHEPIADYWNLNQQKFYEGVFGSRLYGAPSSWYAGEYCINDDIINGTAHPPTEQNIGQYLNGKDAYDMGGYDCWYALSQTNGQFQEQDGTPYNFSAGGRLKPMFWFNDGNFKWDQLDGNRWYNLINYDNSTRIFQLQCDSSDHAAFPAQCPVAGGPFTGYTSGGSAVGPGNLIWPKLRLFYDPGPTTYYLSGGYTPYQQQAMHGLKVLGYDMSHGLADLAARTGTDTSIDFELGYNFSTPQFNWDPTVVVPGIPAVVTYSEEYPTLSCGTSPGTTVSTLGLAHGNGGGPGSWVIWKASDPTHYAISGNNLVTVGTLPCDASQFVQVQTTQSGGRSVIGELHLHVNSGGGATGGTITPGGMSVNPSTFVASTSNAGATVGTLFASVSSGAFAGTWALSTTGGCSGLGANNGLFTIVGSTLKIGGSAISSAGAKAICVSATDSNFTNSPQYQALTVTANAGPALVVNNTQPVTAGQPVSITLSNGLGFSRDWINIVPTGSGNTTTGTWAYLNGSQSPPSSPQALPATISLIAPAAGSYEVRYMENDGYTVGATAALTTVASGGGGGGSCGSGGALGPLALLTTNTHYFKRVNGCAVFLTGLHTWTNFATFASAGASSFTQFADYALSLNNTLIRLWNAVGLLSYWTDPSLVISPSAYNRSGTCCAHDGGNKYDLTSFNATYFNQLKSDVQYAASKGMYVSVELLYHYGAPGDDFLSLAFNGINNINGTATSSNTIYSGADSATVSFEKAFMHHILDTLANEPNVIYEMSNEPDASVSFTYENSLIDDVHSYETAHSQGPHPTGQIIPSSYFASSHGDYVIDQDFNNTPGVFDIGKPVVVDTDHTFGIGGGTDWWWQEFMNGNNPLSMDDMNGTGVAGATDSNNSGFHTLEAQNRLAMQQTGILTGLVDMTTMVPHGELSNLGYALADTTGHKYMVYAGGVGSVTVNLASANGAALKLFWLSTANGSLSSTTNITGGGSQTFTSPFGGTPATLVITP